MKFIPYFFEEFGLSISHEQLEAKLRNSNLRGTLRENELKIVRPIRWLSNPFRPVAGIRSSNFSPENSQIVASFRPHALGICFVAFWVGGLTLELLDALINGPMVAIPPLLLLLLSGYFMMFVGFWIEVPLLKRELRKLLETNT